MGSCDAVIKEDPLNVKALFRRGSAHNGLGDFHSAVVDLKRCLEVQPDNVDAKRALRHVTRAQKAEDLATKETYSKMSKCLGTFTRPSETDGVDRTQGAFAHVAHVVEGAAQGPGSDRGFACPVVQTEDAVTDDPNEPTDGEATDLRSQRIRPGLSVRIEGLSKRGELNGEEGRVVTFDPRERRWRVMLNSGQPICTKPSNMLVNCEAFPVLFGPRPPQE